MIILTAASDRRDGSMSEVNRKFSFRRVIEHTVDNAARFGYKTVVYDLGGLGIGQPFQVEDETFKQKGYFVVLRDGYRSKSLFKPDLIKRCLDENREFTVYLDGDALLYDRIDEIMTDDYDIGVTLRKAEEISDEWHEKNADIVKYVNAGVVFLNPTKATTRFVDQWIKTTIEVKNDQMALNKLVCPEEMPPVNSIRVMNGVRIKYFPGVKYNYYYFEDSLPQDLKIVHFKGPMRNFFPLDWKVRLYCKTLVPLINMAKPYIKKIYSPGPVR